MQPPELPSSTEGGPPPLPETIKAKNPSTGSVLGGCGCLVLLAISALFVFSFFTGKGSTAETPMEQQLAFLDFNEKHDESSPLVAEYKELIGEISQQFEITPKEAANMTYFVVKNHLKPEGFQTTTLEMLRAARQVATSRNANMLGKGTKAYSRMLASLVAQMKSSRERGR